MNRLLVAFGKIPGAAYLKANRPIYPKEVFATDHNIFLIESQRYD